MDQGFKKFVLKKAFSKKGCPKKRLIDESEENETFGHLIERNMPLWGDQYVGMTGLPLKQDYPADTTEVIKAAHSLSKGKQP